ncbi:MAG: hypothetical protein ACRDSP_26895 [Pseudonocardiaceae bacterium]
MMDDCRDPGEQPFVRDIVVDDDVRPGYGESSPATLHDGAVAAAS